MFQRTLSKKKSHKTHRWRQVMSREKKITPEKSEKLLVKFYQVKMEHCRMFQNSLDMGNIQIHRCIVHNKDFQTKKTLCETATVALSYEFWGVDACDCVCKCALGDFCVSLWCYATYVAFPAPLLMCTCAH